MFIKKKEEGKENEKQQIKLNINEKLQIYKKYEKEIKFYILGIFVFFCTFFSWKIIQSAS